MDANQTLTELCSDPKIGCTMHDQRLQVGSRPEIFKEEGYRLMGAAFEVYNERGYGLLKEIYQECLEIELSLRHIAFESKAELNCSTKESSFGNGIFPIY